MATDPTPLADILPGILDYLEERRAWLTAGGARVDLPAHLAILGHELNRPREEACGYKGWRRSLRLAHYLAGVRRQPTLILCRWSLTAVAMGLLAEATGFQHFRLVLGLVGGGDLTRARLAAEALGGLPLQLAHVDLGMGWQATGGDLIRTVVLDHPMGHQGERELARNQAMGGAGIYSPIRPQ